MPARSAAGDDVLKDAMLREVLDLGPEAAVEHLGHTRSDALEEPGGVVHAVHIVLLA